MCSTPGDQQPVHIQRANDKIWIELNHLCSAHHLKIALLQVKADKADKADMDVSVLGPSESWEVARTEQGAWESAASCVWPRVKKTKNNLKPGPCR